MVLITMLKSTILKWSFWYFSLRHEVLRGYPVARVMESALSALLSGLLDSASWPFCTVEKIIISAESICLTVKLESCCNQLNHLDN